MAKSNLSIEVVSEEIILEKIFLILGQKVIIDKGLAEMYGVETAQPNRSVKRNSNRFPADFMSQLSKDEFQNLKYQIGISSSWGGTRKLPCAFTEQGVAMLSSVLNSETAIQVIPIAIGTNNSLGHQNETIDYRQQRPLDKN